MTPRRAPGRLVRGLALAAALVVATLPGLGVGRAAGTELLSGALAAQVRASPLQSLFTLTAGSIQVGQSVKAEAKITNIGKTTLSGIVVELRADPAGLSVKGSLVQLGQLKPGRAATVTWSVCGRTPGSDVLLARVTEGGASIDTVARLLSVTPGGKKACP